MLSRRDFLELLGGLLGQSILSSSSARFIQEERFVSKDLGITFCKPAHWVFIPPEVLAKEARDIGDAVGASCLSPSVMNISKEAWQYNPKRFTPGINIWSFEEEYFDSLLEMAEYVRNSHKMYRGFRVTREYENTEIAGCPAIAFTTELIFDTKGIDRPTQIRDRFVCIQHEERFLEIALCDAPGSGLQEEESFAEFLQSLVIAEPECCNAPPPRFDVGRFG
jgi:hypothetical protein